MATIAIPGRKAYLRFSSASTATTSQTALLELQNFTLTVNESDIVVTSHDSSGWEERITGIRSAKWTASANFISTGAQGSMRQSLLDADATQNVTFLMTTSVTAKKFSFKTRVQEFSCDTPTEGQATAAFGGASHGSISRTA